MSSPSPHRRPITAGPAAFAVENLETRRHFSAAFSIQFVAPAPKLVAARPFATVLPPANYATTTRPAPQPLVPQTNAAGTGLYTGQLFFDNNSDGSNNNTDQPITNKVVYNDANNNGALDAGETSTVSDTAGIYTLALTTGQRLAIRYVGENDAIATTPGAFGTTAEGVYTTNLGYFPTRFDAFVGTNTYTVRAAGANNDRIAIYHNSPTTGTPMYLSPSRLVTRLTFNGNSGDDTFDVDLSAGAPWTLTTLVLSGGTQTKGDTVRLLARNAGSTATFVSGTGISSSNFAVQYAGLESAQFVGGAGDDTLNIQNLSGDPVATPRFLAGGGSNSVRVESGTYDPNADLGENGASVAVGTVSSGAVRFSNTQHLASLSLSGSATSTLNGNKIRVRTQSLSIESAGGARLDIGNGALIVDYDTAANSPATRIAGYVATGYNNGAWNGRGIRSLTAVANGRTGDGVGSGEASAALGLAGTATGTFWGETVDATTVLVRYTAYGDADLNGTVDFNDFLRVQSKFGSAGTSSTSFTDGNFTYDNVTNFDDFLRLQANFGRTV